jgi:hypothetical protein
MKHKTKLTSCIASSFAFCISPVNRNEVAIASEQGDKLNASALRNIFFVVGCHSTSDA